MSRLLLPLLMLCVAFAGCAETALAPASAAVECGEGEVVHPYEGRCLDGDASFPYNERCNLWLGDGVERDDVLYCGAKSDGAATAVVDFEGEGAVRVLLRDGANEEVAEETFGPGQHTLPATGDGGAWRLVVDFNDATGPVVVDLWG